MKKITVTLQELFDICNMQSVENDDYKDITEEILVQTPESTWVPIRGLIKKTDDKLLIKFASGNSFVCGSKHIAPSSIGMVHIINAPDVYNVLLNTFDKIIDKISLPYGEVFDISIDAPHLYVTPNGYVHHNTTVARALCNDIGAEYIMVNGSDEGRYIDQLRDKVKSFASTISLTDAKKVIIIDEADYLNCFAASQEILVLRNNIIESIPISELENKSEQVLSVNDAGVLSVDTAHGFQNGEAEVFEVEFEDGSIIHCTKDHPFFSEELAEKFIELDESLYHISSVDINYFVDNNEKFTI